LESTMGFCGESAEDAEAARRRTKELEKNVEMDEQLISWEDLKTRYNVPSSVDEWQEKGLTTAQAAANFEKFGLNELTPPKTTPLWVKFIEELTGFFSLLLWLAGIMCFVSYGLKPDEENLYLGIVLVTVVMITGIFSFLQNTKSDNLMDEFAKMKPEQVTVVRGGKPIKIDPAVLTPGDIVKLSSGELLPADVRIISCSDDMAVDNSSLTGEPEPQRRNPNKSDPNALESENIAFFGTQVPVGSAVGVVVNVGDNTVMGRIASLAMTTSVEQTPINKEIEHFIHIISAIAIILGVSFFIIGGGWWAADFTQNVVFMIGIIVANVPEGLLATVTVCLTLTAQRMYTKQVRVKNLEGVETLGSTSCICSDKTGTLTQNIMTVAQVVYGNKDGFKIFDCPCSFTKYNKDYDDADPSFQALCRCAVLNNESIFSGYLSEDLNDKAPKPFGESPKGEYLRRDNTGKVVDFSRRVVQGDGSTVDLVAWEVSGNASEAAMNKFVQGILAAKDADGKVVGTKGFPDYDSVEEWKDANKEIFKIPFNSKNKYQIHVNFEEESSKPYPATKDDANKSTGNRRMLMKGAPERIFGRCKFMLKGGEVVAMTDTDRKEIEDMQLELSKQGLRVLGFAEKVLDSKTYGPDYDYSDADKGVSSTPNFPVGGFYDEANRDPAVKYDPIHKNAAEGLVFLGMMALIDPPRPAVPGAVAKCKTAGVKVIMVTGDHPVTAEAISYKVGILWSPTRSKIEEANARAKLSPGDEGWQDPDSAEAVVVPGWEISADDGDEKWDAILAHPQIVFARTSPQQKLVIVGNCQRTGHIVAVTGDGVNDSPALKKADIGVAMGIAGTPVTKNAADMILMDDNFASIVAGIEEGRLIFDNLKKSICYTLTSNIPEISPFLCFITLRTPLPLSTVLILAIDLGTDMVPAISMAYEEAEADIMERPPRDAKKDRLVTKKLIFFAYLQIGIMQAMAGFYAWMVVLNDYGYPPSILLGLGAGVHWEKMPLFCRYNGGQYVNEHGEVDVERDPMTMGPGRTHPLWDRGDSGRIIDCEFPLRNFKGADGAPADFDHTDSSTYTKTEGYPMVTIESISALEADNYFAYVPYRGRLSSFWRTAWLSQDVLQEDMEIGAMFGPVADVARTTSIYFEHMAAGLYSLCLGEGNADGLGSGTALSSTEQSNTAAAEAYIAADGMTVGAQCADGTVLDSAMVYDTARFCNGGPADDASCAVLDNSIHQVQYCVDECSTDCVAGEAGAEGVAACVNIASRMLQKEALHNAQGAYWVSIVVVQWADLLICKTRWLSMRQQGLRNSTLNFGLFFETLLAAWLCYCKPFHVLGTRNIRFTHWLPGLPWSMLIFTYDEVRKVLMRGTSPVTTDPATGQLKRVAGWLERNTYY